MILLAANLSIMTISSPISCTGFLFWGNFHLIAFWKSTYTPAAPGWSKHLTNPAQVRAVVFFIIPDKDGDIFSVIIPNTLLSASIHSIHSSVNLVVSLHAVVASLTTFSTPFSTSNTAGTEYSSCFHLRSLDLVPSTINQHSFDCRYARILNFHTCQFVPFKTGMFLSSSPPMVRPAFFPSAMATNSGHPDLDISLIIK